MVGGTMDKEKIRKVLEELKKERKRKFTQSFDLIINLKDFDIKSNPINFFATLHYPRGKKVSTCALVGHELAEKAKEACDLTITEKEFDKYKDDKKAVQDLAKKYDYFIAQANLMAKVATVFGKVLGPKG
ncbi:50S ribosomal protein L1, partial [Nanoarchaeota archaeon]